MRGSLILGFMLALLVFASVTVAGPKWDIDEDSWMKLSFLGQVHGSYTDDADPETDIYLRRARVILAGQIMEGVRFFVETDNDNAGKHGADTASTDIQDAFIDLQIMDSDHWVEAGLILLPFSFESRSSAASLLGLDYNSETIKFVNHFVWRDYGAELHGNFGDKISYCVGAFDGYDSTSNNKNPDAALRVTGHVAANLIGKAETGWFYGQDRRGKGDYLSVGIGADVQDKATLTITEADSVAGTDETAVEQDSEAWVADFQSSMAVGSANVTVNGAWYDWDNSAFKGNTAFIETGVMVGNPMVTMKYSLQDPDSGDDTQDYTAGLHYFMKDHNARCGVEYRWGDSADQVLVGVQFLL